MLAAIAVFPGTNCDKDTYRALKYLGWDCNFIWHNETDIKRYDVIFLPGGFSYGDYVRSGRLAKFSPVVAALKNFQGMTVGICNGFQILCEAHFLPGVLTDNINNRFICDEVNLKFLNSNISLPIAHKEGRFLACGNDISDLVFLKYINNPNGSEYEVAGLYDRKNKIIGMMPHPERAVFKETGCTDGIKIFEFIKKELNL